MPSFGLQNSSAQTSYAVKQILLAKDFSILIYLTFFTLGVDIWSGSNKQNKKRRQSEEMHFYLIINLSNFRRLVVT